MADKFKIREIFSLNLAEASAFVEDLVEIQFKNVRERENFLKTKKRALFLPHCSRKYMDGRCQANFDPEIPTYRCAHCSPDCLIKRSTELGERNGYDVYVLPGGTCLPSILEKNSYEGVVGVACSQELRQVEGLLKKRNLSEQAVFLSKNGCANTKFSLESLKKIL